MNLRTMWLYGLLIVILPAGGLLAWDGGDALSLAGQKSADAEWKDAELPICTLIWVQPQTQPRVLTWLPPAAKISRNDQKIQSAMPFQMAYPLIFHILPQPSLLSLECTHQI